MLEGREFLLFTHHKPLTSALFRISLPWTARQQRHLPYISEFTSSIMHVSGMENTVAHTLFRPSSFYSTQCFSSWCQRIPEIELSLFCLARLSLRRQSLGQSLTLVPSKSVIQMINRRIKQFPGSYIIRLIKGMVIGAEPLEEYPGLEPLKPL